jgi:hypothetical protein
MGAPSKQRRRVWVVTVRKQRTSATGTFYMNSVSEVRFEEQPAHDYAEKHRRAGTLVFFAEYDMTKDMTMPEVV